MEDSNTLWLEATNTVEDPYMHKTAALQQMIMWSKILTMPRLSNPEASYGMDWHYTTSFKM